MNDLRQLLFYKERIGKVMDLLRKGGIPDPQEETDRALIYAHALVRYGDYDQALRIYSAIPPHPSYEAERLWGQAYTLYLTGDMNQARRLLGEAEASNPPDWLLPRIHNTWFNLHLLEGNFEEGYRAIERGITASEREPSLVMRWVLEGNRGAIEDHQGLYEEALRTLGMAVTQLSAQGAVVSAGHNLVSLATMWVTLGDLQEAGRYLVRAEKFIQESGSMPSLILLRIIQGTISGETGPLEKAEHFYGEAQKLLQKVPVSKYEIKLGFSRAFLAFKKGSVSEALRLIRKTRSLIQEKGLLLLEDIALYLEGSFLLRVGSVREGLEVLGRAATMAEGRKKLGLISAIALYQAYGHEELKQRGEALERMAKCLTSIEATRGFQDVLSEREVLIPLLLRIGESLPLTDAMSNLIVQLRHPGLVKQLLHRSPEGKSHFLRFLKVSDAHNFRPLLARLRNDPEKEIRRASRLILQNWQSHTGYRVYTLGTFRVFLEGKPFIEGAWGRAGVKRLFLYFLTRPEEWQATEALLETLWEKKTSRPRSPEALWPLFSNLRSLFEPWHLPDMDYVFFQSRRGAYGFFPGERFWMDYQEFEKGIKQAEKDHRDRNFKEARKAYREALDLYIGDFLEEFPYEDWLRPKCDYLRELYFRGVMRYATLERDSGNLPEARRVLEEALFKDLSRCDCITLLIQTLAQMKFTQQAKDWGQRHIKYMKKELKEKPASEVVEALKHLM
jgi:tetratricopeptide (TPR) repeat protein